MSNAKQQQAYPTWESDTHYPTGGMTLRDYFAGQALAGICADGGGDLRYQHELTKAAYECADAMLKEREK